MNIHRLILIISFPGLLTSIQPGILQPMTTVTPCVTLLAEQFSQLLSILCTVLLPINWVTVPIPVE